MKRSKNLYIHLRPEGRYVTWEPRLVKKRSIFLRDGENLTLEDIGSLMGLTQTDKRIQVRLSVGFDGVLRI